MEAYAHRVLSAWSRHDSTAAPHKGREFRGRSLLGPSRQHQLTASGSGVIPYEPTGYYIDGADFSQFFQEAHANPNVTGELSQALLLNLHACNVCAWCESTQRWRCSRLADFPLGTQGMPSVACS